MIAALLLAAAMVPVALADPATDGPNAATLARVAPSVLRVVAEECGADGSARAGSGFAWQTPGQVVTDLHVVVGCQRLSVGYQQLDVRPARVARVLRQADLALLSVDAPPAVPTLSLAPRPPPIGAVVDVFGFALGQPTRDTHPLQMTFANQEAPLLGDVLPDAERADIRKVGFPALETQVLRLDGNLLPGHSGAPLIDAEGKVVGVGSGGLERGAVGVGWAIRAQYVDGLPASTEAVPTTAAEASSAFAVAVPSPSGDDGVRCGGMTLHRRRVLPLADIAATSDDPERLEALSDDLVRVKLPRIAHDLFAIWTEPLSAAGIVLPHRLQPQPGGDVCAVQSLSPSVRYLVRVMPIPAASGTRAWADAVAEQQRLSSTLIEHVVGVAVHGEPHGAFQSRRWLNGALIRRRMFHAVGPDGRPMRLYRTDMAGGGAYILAVVINSDADAPDTLAARDRLAWARGVFGVHLTAFPPSRAEDVGDSMSDPP